VPAGALERREPSGARWPACGATAESRESLQRGALGARWSIRHAAAEYQVAEGDLRVEVANASPDLALGPGMFFDQGTGKFTLAAALPSLPLRGNRGPIAEAVARRTVASGRLVEAQELVLAQVESALADCEASRRELAVADSVVAETARRAQLVKAAYERGEAGRLEVALAELDLVRVRRLIREAEFRQLDAGLGLEQAVGAWGTRDDGQWPVSILPAVPWRMQR
jgi:outer membrane protein TolC